MKKTKVASISRIGRFWAWLRASKVRMIVGAVIVMALGYFIYGRLSAASKKPSYQTTTVQSGTLVVSVNASGNIIKGNSMDVTTAMTGMVKNVYVKNGDIVTAGQRIADFTLDQASAQKAASAWATYLQAKNSVDSANSNLWSLQNLEFVANQKFINDAVARNLATNDPTYVQEYAAWKAAEANYNNGSGAISAAQASLGSAALTLAQNSAVVSAPIAGTVTDLSVSSGAPITATIASVVSGGSSGVQAQVDLSEIDSVNIQAGEKATLTIDALPGKTYTGRLVSLNTNGVVSSGVSTYPAVIAFDAVPDNVYPNMSVSANIITKVKDNVLLVPSGAIQNQNGVSMVRVLKNGQVGTVTVEVGDSSDTETEITSGLNAGDVVVVGVVNGSTTSSAAATSPFGVRTGGFGGAIRGGGGR